MGALHAGHESLVARARAECDTVAVSIFVNPLQFDDPADFARYPRTEAQDQEQLAGAGADLVLLLPREQMYPPGFRSAVVQPPVDALWEGAARPGHFRGVLTVVAKLFALVRPALAYFGQKDYQQTVLIARMAADLDFDTRIVVCPTLRAADGLALSSRNVFLSEDERRRALALVAALSAAQRAFDDGERAAAALEAVLAATLAAGGVERPDYAVIVDPETLLRRAETPGDPVALPGDVALLAARVGPVRLIDNHRLGARLAAFSGAPDSDTRDR